MDEPIAPLTNRLRYLPFLLVVIIGITGCNWYDDRVTYFNTYYNMERIMDEVKDEFDYIDENRRVKPRVLVPGLDSALTAESVEGGSRDYKFLRAFVIDRSKLQPVSSKVDSLLLKGSKIMANHPKSSYMEGSLFLMAESYFFRQEWIPSQQKCIELIELYSDGDHSPDAHLLLSKDYLLQRKISQGKQMLSRTIDVAWYKDRYDILGEAYRIQAEMALEEGDLEGAVAPYKQAIAQLEDDEVRARWQVDVAGLYYRMGKYSLAEQAFRRVDDYTPDILAEYESQLYLAATLVRLDSLDDAESIFDDLDENENYEEWGSYVAAERLALDRARAGDLDDPTLIAAERRADTSFIGKPEMMAQSFQKAMTLYKQDKYEDALVYFAKAKVIRTPVYEVAQKYFTLLKQWEDQHRKVRSFQTMVVERESMRDSIKVMNTKEVFALGRVHEQLGNKDSALFYYKWAYDSTSKTDQNRGKYLYSQARLVADDDPEASDSLFMVINEEFPNSPYGQEASASLGFVADAMIDDASELYRSGMSFRRIQDYSYAARQFNSIVSMHKGSDYAPKALYALGWMFERDIDDKDSALHYYGLLIEKYPRSEYAKDVRPSVEFAIAKRNNVDVEDSVLFKNLDEELYKRAKAGEQDVLDQLIQKNADAVQISGPPGLELPSIPGLTPEGGSINDMMRNEVKKFTVPGSASDSTRVPDTTRVKKP